MPFKIFEVTYNDGGIHSTVMPHFFYIARCKEDVIAHSQKYRMYLEWKAQRGGNIWIHEVSGLSSGIQFENLSDFDISISAKEMC